MKRSYQSTESFIWWSVVESILDEGPAQLYEHQKKFKAEMTEKLGYLSPTPRFVHQIFLIPDKKLKSFIVELAWPKGATRLRPLLPR